MAFTVQYINRDGKHIDLQSMRLHDAKRHASNLALEHPGETFCVEMSNPKIVKVVAVYFFLKTKV